MLASAFSAFLSCMNILGLVVAIFLLIFPILFFGTSEQPIKTVK